MKHYLKIISELILLIQEIIVELETLLQDNDDSMLEFLSLDYENEIY